MSPHHLGSTRKGARAWLLQRLTSVYMAGFTVFLIIYFAVTPPATYAQWRDWWGGAALRIAMGLFIGSVLIHAWLGLRSVWMDYLKPVWLRFSISALTGALLVLMALWTARLLLLGQP